MYSVEIHAYENGAVGELLNRASFDTLPEAVKYADERDAANVRIFVTDEDHEIVYDC